MYANLKKIYDETRLDGFAMAITYVVDIGYRNAKDITDDEINEAQGNGIMTQGFVQNLMKLAREIANSIDNPTELIQFCDAENVFETEYYTNGEHLSRGTLEETCSKLINFVLYDDSVSFDANSHEEAIEYLADYLGVEVEDLESLMERG